MDEDGFFHPDFNPVILSNSFFSVLLCLGEMYGQDHRMKAEMKTASSILTSIL